MGRSSTTASPSTPPPSTPLRWRRSTAAPLHCLLLRTFLRGGSVQELQAAAAVTAGCVGQVLERVRAEDWRLQQRACQDHPHRNPRPTPGRCSVGPFAWNYKPAEKLLADFLWEKNTVPAEKTSWIRRIISQMNRAIVCSPYAAPPVRSDKSIQWRPDKA
jgi:hypothetical protein